MERQLPNNIEAEECLLGCMLVSPAAVGRTIELNVSFGDFYDPKLALLFDAVRGSYDTSGVIDDVVIVEALEAQNLLERIGGRNRILELITKPPSALNIDFYANIVLELSSLRSLIGAAEQIMQLGHQRDREAASLVDEAESLIFSVAEKKTADSVYDSDILAHQSYEHLRLVRDKSIAPGTPTGFQDYDNLIMGLQPSCLYILAARPGAGKSAYAMAMATNIAQKTDKPVMFFSMEMSNRELMNRIISSTSQMSYRNIQSGSMNSAQFENLKTTVDEIASWPLFIDDDPNCTVLQMRAKARRLKAKHGDLGAVFVDYIQLMSSTKKVENRTVEVSELSRGLKILAKELDCPVVALSQLNRQLEYRADKRPMLADLRESGSIEQDADVVTFLYRDELYDPDSEDKGICEVIVAKNRGGATGKVRLAFIDRCVRFASIPKTTEEYY